jgi:hypothetical protein
MAMGKKKITLPDFKTIDEMAEFFDKTDTTLIDSFEEVDIKFVRAPGPHRSKGVHGVKRRRSLRSS